MENIPYATVPLTALTSVVYRFNIRESSASMRYIRVYRPRASCQICSVIGHKKKIGLQLQRGEDPRRIIVTRYWFALDFTMVPR